MSNCWKFSFKGSKNVAATTADPCECKMDIETSEITSAQTAVPRPESNSQRMFGNLTSFKESMWPTIGENSRANDFEEDWDKEDAANNHFDINDYLIVPPMKPGIDRNNNTKPSSSFFQLAKRFCGNVRNNVECGIDEITKQLALLRFVPCWKKEMTRINLSLKSINLRKCFKISNGISSNISFMDYFMIVTGCSNRSRRFKTFIIILRTKWICRISIR